MSKPKSIALTLFLIILLGAVGGGGYLLLKDQQAPLITVTPGDGRLSKNSSLEISLADQASGLKNLTVLIRKNTNTTTIYQQDWMDRLPERKEVINLSSIDLKEGAFELIVKASDGSYAAFGKGNTATREYSYRLDTTPPRVSVITMPPYVRRGGVGVIAYSVSEETSSTGVQVGDTFFPGYQQSSGNYLCFFAFPYYLTVDEYKPRLIAKDMAGNAYDRPAAVYPLDREFTSDRINLSESFLSTKMPEFEQEFPGEMTHLERFLKVNRDMRVANRASLISIGLQTSPEMLWKGPFLRLPNAANRARFAEKRTYVYNGVEVDQQYHLGHDLASTRHAPVPAANDGKVVFADTMGIYGQVVIVDHGLGLQTLYAHLSEFAVQAGQNVLKGDIVGKTGVTGMAGGDHLHYGVLASGIPVTPLEWFDSHWIQDNITGRLN
jgi:hypothetical protein